MSDGDPAAAPADPDVGRPLPLGRRRGPRLRRAITALVVLALLAAAVAAVRAFLVAPYYIPSASMEPTLHGCATCDNDRVIVDKLSYHMHAVHRGDVVVFNRPTTWAVPDKVLIKRVIGLPGDRLSLRNRHLYVNGLRLVEPYVNSQCPPMSTLRAGTPAHRLGPVPAGEIFVMGDNRCDSSDSRIFGPVPESDLIGRAVVIFWPPKRLHYL